MSGIRKAPKAELLVSSTPESKRSDKASNSTASWNAANVSDTGLYVICNNNTFY